MSDKNTKSLFKETYLSVIKNSVGTKSFQNFYAKINNKKQDIMNGGELSCAFFVSSITTMFGLSARVHGTVDNAVKDFLNFGWVEIKKPRIGAILIWEDLNFEGEKHKHIGFYITKDEAISNNSVKKVPQKHSWDFKGKRKVVKILWNEKLK
ncbi:MAG: hypothetical protein COX80_03440 [Candidatus Magasanikbacteria bacterium CG_4_10_14_0_2_um_filter_33_14]|uniref:NlpC/P60 domain-containing protein n=1 Tax=Candidatus Magasanikbacteria bacterium CG_4_10_14_0_2_um_filter_33_14 TaxID=1974636 RepID=A0A2M7VA50_9BACT|nr:MAG: hypothetical protein COX80_03440 [Candidatus Magasanikbacteria bacterium CG_4_10_14_0_2_um_filter_33_14]